MTTNAIRTRSVTLADQLRAKWRDQIKSQPPEQRLRWLKSAEGIVALGARTCAQIRRQIVFETDRVRGMVCSGAWADQWLDDGAEYPPGGLRGTAMVWSRARVRYGSGRWDAGGNPLTGPARQRLTPRHCVDSEDALDSMSAAQAALYRHPPSPSAMAIFLHCTYARAGLVRMVDRGGSIGRGRNMRGTKARRHEGTKG